MSVEIRPFDSLGHAEFGWLDARHHFSFGHYYDPSRMNVGPLRVWNDDTIQPGTGFDAHPHRDMEIITYVREGAISHRDSLGNSGRTVAGDIQVMSAGTGIVHEEFNREDETARIFQIWIIPRRRGQPPRWETRTFPKGESGGALVPMASGRAGIDGAVPIDQDATLFAGTLPAGSVLDHALGISRQAYIVPARGSLIVDGQPVGERDGAIVRDAETVRIEVTEEAEIILVDVAAD
ncbi:MAG: pirin family protein [Alphaproteobacteria bacterium]|nr:pirin family protein [Alphaproteobacteria bacterium]MBO6863211.1 pirin family protein [Alphaproteobacteria bacterium]